MHEELYCFSALVVLEDRDIVVVVENTDFGTFVTLEGRDLGVFVTLEGRNIVVVVNNVA
jgi:hypothetical protein